MKKREVVKSKIDFNKIIKTGKSIYNNIGYSRYGISVGTKLGNAVFRNKYKRKIRMIITKNKEILNNSSKDFIILFRKAGTNLDHKSLENKFIELAKELKEN